MSRPVSMRPDRIWCDICTSFQPAWPGFQVRGDQLQVCEGCVESYPHLRGAGVASPSYAPMAVDVRRLMQQHDIDQDEAVRRLGGTP